MLFKRFMFFLLLLPAHQQVAAQSGIYSLTLENYIAEGLKNNLTLQQAEIDVAKSLLALEEAKGVFLPSISFEATYTLADGGRVIGIPVGDLLNPVYSSLNQLTASESFPQINNVSEQFLPNNFHETFISFRQPLFNTDIYYNYKARKELITLQQAKKQAYQNVLIAEIRKAYFEYQQAALVVDIYRQTKNLRQELVKLNQSLVDNDKATADVLYLAQAAVLQEQKQIAAATEQLEVAKAYFNFLLNKPLKSEIEINAGFQQALQAEGAVASLQENTDVSKRQELQQLKAGIAANAIDLQRLEAKRKLPTAYVGAQIGYQGFDYTFDSNQDYWLVQVGLSWSIFNGGTKKAKEQQVRLEDQRLNTQYQELQQQLQLQVVQAQEALRSAEASIAASEAEILATEAALNIITKKYENNTAILVELLDAQTRFRNARLALSIAQFGYLKQYTQLQKAQGNY